MTQQFFKWFESHAVTTGAVGSICARAALLLLLAAGPLLAMQLHAQPPNYERVRVLEPRAIANAELTDQNGRAFKLSALQGRVTFILFGFTHCPDVCPVSMERLRRLEESAALSSSSVAYVMISVDGERDTPAAMKSFLAKYSFDFIGLTAQPDVVKPIAAQFSAAFFKGGSRLQDHSYDVAHSPQIFVLDRAGRLRAEVHGASTDTMAEVALALLAESD